MTMLIIYATLTDI